MSGNAGPQACLEMLPLLAVRQNGFNLTSLKCQSLRRLYLADNAADQHVYEQFALALKVCLLIELFALIVFGSTFEFTQ